MAWHFIEFSCMQIIAFFAPSSTPTSSAPQPQSLETSTAELASPTANLRPQVPVHDSPSSAAMPAVTPAAAASSRVHETMRSQLRNAMHSASALLDPEVSRVMLQGYLSVRESLQHLEGLYTVMGHAVLSPEHDAFTLEPEGGVGEEGGDAEQHSFVGGALNLLSEPPMRTQAWQTAQAWPEAASPAPAETPWLRRSARLQARAAAGPHSTPFTTPDVSVGHWLVSAMGSSHDMRQRRRRRQGGPDRRGNANSNGANRVVAEDADIGFSR
jgi:hypothetical protein